MDYVLLVDTPTEKAGTLFKLNKGGEYYFSIESPQSYSRELVEDLGNGWFKGLDKVKPPEPSTDADHLINKTLAALNKAHERQLRGRCYNTMHLVSFGNYLLSDKRKECFHAGSYAEIMQRLNHVHDNDLANWQDKINNMDVE